MDYNQAVKYVNDLGLIGHSATLDRMNLALKKLNTENRFKVIHIAGTNGKGSVCAYISCALSAAGVKTGLFISPHIFDIKERIQVNGKKIGESDFARLVSKIADLSCELSMFECLTLVAFMYFNEMGVEVAVLETGLGGRLDATNTAKNKLITAITKIGLDHEKILGDTAEKIATEKCGIINTEKTVCSPQESSSVLGIIKEHANCLIIPDKTKLSEISVSVSGNSFKYKDDLYETGMGGYYQIDNAITAIEILENCGIKIPLLAIKKGLKSAFMPARMQVVSRNPLVIVDGAHNPDGATQLCKTQKENPGFTAVVGFMRDKDYEQVLSKTLPAAKKVICVTASDSLRALPAEELFKTAQKYNKNCSFSDNIEKTLEMCLKEETPVFVYGSLYLAARVLEIFKSDN